MDLYGEKSLIRLCRALCEIEGLRWIRLLYCYPEEITDELIAYIKDEPKVVKYLDMPVQHASDRILKRMNRKTTRKEIKERIRSIRKAVPGITLRTTVMTGFPGETEKDFEELLSFVKSVKFDRLGAFSYSKEEGTPAAKLKDQIPKRLKDKRKNAVMREQKKISEAKNFARVGKKFECMIEGRVADEENLYVGRTYMDAPDVDGYVFVHSARELLSGEFVCVRITDASSYDLIGEIVS